MFKKPLIALIIFSFLAFVLILFSHFNLFDKFLEPKHIVITIAFITSMMTGLFVYLAGVLTPETLAWMAAYSIAKRFKLFCGILIIEEQDEEERYTSHTMNLRALNNSRYAMHNVCAYLTVSFTPSDRAHAASPRIIDFFHPARPAYRQILWWSKGNRCTLATDLRPGETVDLLFLRFQDEGVDTDSLDYVDDDSIARSITLGTVPGSSNEMPIIQLKRKHSYVCWLTIVCDEARPICHRLQVEPTNFSTKINKINYSSLVKEENKEMGIWDRQELKTNNMGKK